MSENNQHDDQEGEIVNLTADTVERFQAWRTWNLGPWLGSSVSLDLCPHLYVSIPLCLSLYPSYLPGFLSPSLWVSVPSGSLPVDWCPNLLGQCCGNLHLLLGSMLVHPEVLSFPLLPLQVQGSSPARELTVGISGGAAPSL